MYSLPQYNNNHQSYYYSLAQLFEPKRYSHYESKKANCNSALNSNCDPYQFTFNRNFGSNQYLNLGHELKIYTPKYRSYSLPSKLHLRNIKSNDFSYYDQLKRRDYITTNNCVCHQKTKNHKLNNKGKPFCLDIFHSMKDLNRFSKYDPQRRIIKNGLRANVKVFERYNSKNRFTQTNSAIQHKNQHISTPHETLIRGYSHSFDNSQHRQKNLNQKYLSNQNQQYKYSKYFVAQIESRKAQKNFIKAQK